MPLPRTSRTLSLFFAWLIAVAPLARAQEAQTRPRRVNGEVSETNSAPAQVIINTTRLAAEPTVRIGLATAARSVTISTAASALEVINGASETALPQPLAVARVRIEPRVLGPLPVVNADELFRVEIAAVETAAAAAALVRDVRTLTGEDASVTHDAATNVWRVRVGVPVAREEAEDLRSRLEEAGFAAVAVVAAHDAQSQRAANAGTQTNARGPANPRVETNTSVAARAGTPMPTPPRATQRGADTTQAVAQRNVNPNVRLAASVVPPVRGLVVYAAGAGVL